MIIRTETLLVPKIFNFPTHCSSDQLGTFTSHLSPPVNQLLHHYYTNAQTHRDGSLEQKRYGKAPPGKVYFILMGKTDGTALSLRKEAG